MHHALKKFKRKIKCSSIASILKCKRSIVTICPDPCIGALLLVKDVFRKDVAKPDIVGIGMPEGLRWATFKP
jgi:hypothetical protein